LGFKQLPSGYSGFIWLGARLRGQGGYRPSKSRSHTPPAITLLRTSTVLLLSDMFYGKRLYV